MCDRRFPGAGDDNDPLRIRGRRAAAEPGGHTGRQLDRLPIPAATRNSLRPAWRKDIRRAAISSDFIRAEDRC